MDDYCYVSKYAAKKYVCTWDLTRLPAHRQALGPWSNAVPTHGPHHHHHHHSTNPTHLLDSGACIACILNLPPEIPERRSPTDARIHSAETAVGPFGFCFHDHTYISRSPCKHASPPLGPKPAQHVIHVCNHTMSKNFTRISLIKQRLHI
jgi:hypothetical protein